MYFYIKTLNCSNQVSLPTEKEIENSHRPQVQGQPFLLHEAQPNFQAPIKKHRPDFARSGYVNPNLSTTCAVLSDDPEIRKNELREALERMMGYLNKKEKMDVTNPIFWGVSSVQGPLGDLFRNHQ